MALNELKGFGSVRFFIGTLADWNASGKILAVNEFAIVSDQPGSYKQGQALSSINGTGPVFSALPWFTPDGAPMLLPVVYSSTTGIVAHPGGGQTNAVQLTTEFNEVVTVATEGDSVKLPSSVAGLSITVKNNGAQALAVFPFLADSINNQAVNTSVYLSPGTSKTFRAQDATVWQVTSGPTSVDRIPAAINASATATAAQVATGAITSTSAAPVALVLPTATLLGAYLGAASGTSFDVIIDNSAGANPITVTPGAGTTIPQGTLLTIPAGVVSLFRYYFTSPTANELFNIATTSLSSAPASVYELDVTGTILAANLLKKTVRSLTAAGVTGTLDTATAIGSAFGAVQGTEFDFTVDNSGGANTFTLAVGTGITAATPALTGGATLTVGSGTFGKFKLIFKTPTTALLFRTV